MDLKTFLKPAPDKVDLAMAIIRVVVGLAFFMHGWQKVFTIGMSGVGGFFGSLGIPAAGFFAIVVSLLELLGGLALILGVLRHGFLDFCWPLICWWLCCSSICQTAFLSAMAVLNSS